MTSKQHRITNYCHQHLLIDKNGIPSLQTNKKARFASEKRDMHVFGVYNNICMCQNLLCMRVSAREYVRTRRAYDYTCINIIDTIKK